MKKISLVLVALAVLFAVPVMAANLPGSGIKNSKHNLGSSGFGTFYGGDTSTSQICVFCHTPHNSDANSTRPLWVRTTVDVQQIYSSNTMNGKPALANLTVAKLCLSCHDGSVAPGSTAANLGTSTNTTLDNADLIRAQYNIGGATDATEVGDLSDDHPVGMNYTDNKAADDVAGSNARLRDIGAGGPQQGWFKGGIMECSTCHEVHNSTPNAKFLRVTRDSSGICRTCHNK